VAFAGGVVWMGTGQVVVPSASTHPALLLPGPPADPPGSLLLLPSPFWNDATEEMQLAEQALALVRQTALLHSMVDCGDYTAVAYLYTPTVGVLDPLAAGEVLVLSGRAGPPWGSVAAESGSWGQVKTLYR
jgi:hypothetical protein